MILKTHAITKKFGGLTAVNEVSLSLGSGQLVSLVGPNGAGKTTCFNLVTGFIPLTSGRVTIGDTDITTARPHQRVRMGVTRTFQTTSLFNGLSALQNVQVALSRTHHLPLMEVLLPFGRNTVSAERALELLETVGIAQRANDGADQMSYGDQRRLAVAIALATSPKFLLLDEPAAGLNPLESTKFGQLLRSLVSDGLGVLLVEHDMRLVMQVSDHVHVLATGRTLAAGPPQEVRENPDVVAAYLGRR